MTIQELKMSMPQRGEVMALSFRPKRLAPIVLSDELFLDQVMGIPQDHYSKVEGHRMVTLIQYEHLIAIGEILHRQVNLEDVRRNILVKGINLLALHDSVFMIGEAILLGTGYCHPCSRMEIQLGSGGYNAMRGHGGITAKVLQSGRVRIGDSVQLEQSIQAHE